MKHPDNLESFKDLIGTMKHRERFVFKIPESKSFYEKLMCTHLEVYSTELGGTMERPIIHNILFQTVSIDGKFDKKWNTKRSSYLHLISKKSWDGFYSIITND